MVGPDGFASWVRELAGKSGVYVIRHVPSVWLLYDPPVALYVGESHTRALRKTLCRHFQAWSDSHETAGPTYDRGGVDVAVEVCGGKQAVQRQDALIRRLKPRDDRQPTDDLEEAPF